ncbi:hypothetical protein ACFOEK_09265 [Litoribrevibacter euphylliae]|uniref:Lipoprotein n=1 Tax=Litoribrevibacter euphylliae TaxID=1834034 RepID=A0ABV7HI34_9GAMM
MRFTSTTVIIALVLLLNGCGINFKHYETGFEINPQETWKKRLIWVDEPKFSNFLQNEISQDYRFLLNQQIHLNLIEEINQKTSFTAVSNPHQKSMADYQLYLTLSDFSMSANSSLGASSAAISCSYGAVLQVKNQKQETIFNDAVSQSAEYINPDAYEHLYLPKSQDKCFLARSQVMESLLNNFLKTIH